MAQIDLFVHDDTGLRAAGMALKNTARGGSMGAIRLTVGTDVICFFIASEEKRDELVSAFDAAIDAMDADVAAKRAVAADE